MIKEQLVLVGDYSGEAEEELPTPTEVPMREFTPFSAGGEH